MIFCRMQASGAEKRFEGNAEHDAAQAKQYAEGATDSLLGGKMHPSVIPFPLLATSETSVVFWGSISPMSDLLQLHACTKVGSPSALN